MTGPGTLIVSARLLWKVLAKVPVVTGWLIRWCYPSTKCQQLLLIHLDGSQARFELNSQRPSHALTCMRVWVHNHLPFDVTIDLYRITGFVESQQLLDAVLNMQLVVPPAASAQAYLSEITLTDQQTNRVRELGRDWTNIRVELHCRYRSSIQNWEDLRSFVFLSSINNDRPGN